MRHQQSAYLLMYEHSKVDKTQTRLQSVFNHATCMADQKSFLFNAWPVDSTVNILFGDRQ